MLLQEYDFEIIHKARINHQNADSLSRHPASSTQDYTEARQDHDDDLTSPTVAVLIAWLSNASVCTATRREGSNDIWNDAAAMKFIQTQ